MATKYFTFWKCHSHFE